MTTQIYVGLLAEGATDYRFLNPIIEKALSELVFECSGQVDFDVRGIVCEKGENFVDQVSNASKEGHQNYGITMLIVHTDADHSSSKQAYDNKINPAMAFLQNQMEDSYCKNVAALVPIQETEAWMLADKSAFIKTIGTKRSESELNINGNPEEFTNPKERIVEAIKIGRSEMPKKLRQSLQIADLYSYLGQSIKIERLRNFKSYLDFEKNVRQVLIDLNFLKPK